MRWRSCIKGFETSRVTDLGESFSAEDSCVLVTGCLIQGLVKEDIREVTKESVLGGLGDLSVLVHVRAPF